MMRSLTTFVLTFLLSSVVSAQDDVFGRPDSQIVVGDTMSDIPATETDKTSLMLSDVLTTKDSVSIFYTYARETRAGELLGKEDARITVFAPTNKAVVALARKPHQGPAPPEEGTVISEEELDAKSRENVERWVSAHIVPQHPIRLSPTSQFEALMEGVVITVGEGLNWSKRKPEDPEWEYAVLNKNISLISRHEAANGALYLVDGAIYG